MHKENKNLILVKKMLADCLDILDEFRGKLLSFKKANEIQERSFLDLIENTIDFISRSIQSIALLVRCDESFFKQAIIIVRSIYEYSVRTLWAVRMDDGLYRYQCYWASKDLKFAQEAQKVEKLRVHALEVAKNRQKLIEQIKLKTSQPMMPSQMNQLLDDIEQKDIEDELLDANQRGSAINFYLVVYSTLSRLVHGNAAIFLTPDESLLSHIGGVSVQSTHFICRAFIHFSQESVRIENESLGKRILAIMGVQDATI